MRPNNFKSINTQNFVVPGTVDDDIVAEMAPTQNTNLPVAYSDPQNHRSDVFAADCEFFRLHLGRFSYIRRAYELEFDVTVDENRPTLYVMVQQFAPGHHVRFAFWRGTPCWNEAVLQSDSTDLRTGEAFCLARYNGGVSIREFSAYMSDERGRRWQKMTCKQQEQEHKRSRKWEKTLKDLNFQEEQQRSIAAYLATQQPDNMVN
ncbi:MAG: hypothetical protein FWD64_02210 [Acidobacteriaceae bacterium]|nr:hypothetical protein [Acidobacteriaceae bacterium]